ncbi:hypothetical protein RND81_07G116600 [Saponaria officinalis]|uniref:Cystatin domain-containing protein n=1 Tax=Saponaria officinalis TaxID=3572 RepID=A0AAW1JQX4_SAPOF
MNITFMSFHHKVSPQMKTQPSIIVVIVVLYMWAVTASAARHGAILGGFTPITDVDNEHVQDIAQYAVTEHNLKAGTNLEYLKIMSGEYQVAAGNNYRLLISAKDDSGAVHNFEAVVNDKPWEISRTLTSFNAT